MSIITQYENVPHFCFACRHMGHAAMSCDEVSGEDPGIRFGEELRASPPRRVKEISVKAGLPRAIKPPFQVMESLIVTRSSTIGLKKAGTNQGKDGREQMRYDEPGRRGDDQEQDMK
jgi:hypothetical protein